MLLGNDRSKKHFNNECEYYPEPYHSNPRTETEAAYEACGRGRDRLSVKFDLQPHLKVGGTRAILGGMAPLHPSRAERSRLAGGRGEIRTPETVTRLPHFECGAIDHSATLPALHGDVAEKRAGE